MSDVNARYLGLTANQLAKIATDLKAENAKLREFATHMANALGIDSEWCDPEWCDSDCMDEFKCRPTGDYGEIHCPAFARMTELGIEVPS